ncbi:Outer membrane efflux protein [Candidatus Methylomirabilis lanthanidiphila]|uniref:Outer membrane efflux protein n=1 Tax=Candidatus Methylomirabilis lanthanidiphila TaxID=2211376 RepID=A0A564ZMP1_9BACT|nr:TolC family protein [Candidatus Methylomirabilis lanthanidiphila]VUZ86473.1 Outer membrane efflux protein [Candidatus Methylomirabilis lanthanidiphila]
MTAVQRKVCWWTISVTLLIILKAVVAGAEDELSPPRARSHVGLSDDLRRLVAQAMPQEPSPRDESVDIGELRLGLREAVVLALKNNLDIAIADYDPKIKSEDISIAKAVFDPTFSLTLDANRTISPVSNTLQSGSSGTGGRVDKNDNENRDVNASIAQKLPFGGSYTLGMTNNRLNTNLPFAQPGSPNFGINPAYKTFLTLSITQDLLKNFGMDVNTAPIRIARNNQAISVTQFRQQANQVVTNVHNAYWNLVFAIENLEVQRRSLRLARELEDLNKARVRAGVAAPVEVTQAEAQAAAQVQNVILAEKAIKDAEDQLTLIINFPDGEKVWARTILPTDAPPFDVVQVNMDASIQEALEKRPEYAAQKLTLQNTDLNFRVARNQLLPSLQLQGNVGLNGLNGSAGGDLDRMMSGDFTQWSAALVLTYPLGNRAARSAFIQSKLSRDQAGTSLLNLKRQIISQVREAVRRIETDVRSVEATRAARVLAEEQLRVEQKRLEAGVTTTFNVLSFQRDLAEAQANEIKAITTFNQDLANLELQKGTVLEKNRFEL